jgi:hypothetical protein
MEFGYWDINGHTHVYLGDSLDALHAWGEMMNDQARRTVATDEINNIYISTVFLGVDHGYGGGGPPILFETMAFVHEGGDARYDQICWRYPTWDEAEEGHKQMVALILEGRDPE